MIRWVLIVSLIAVGLLPGCSGWQPEDDSRTYKDSYSVTPDGHYRVRKGDTLHAIAFNFGLDWRDIAAWNGIRSPYTIFPDQDLRLTPAQNRQAKPPASRSTSSGVVVSGTGSGNTTATTRDVPVSRSEPKPPAKPAVADPGKWTWPTEGRLVSRFKANDPTRNGIEIGGKEGQDVIATAAGEVVYSGSGLIGYGELIIIKHNDRMLSAYAQRWRANCGNG
jgi:lipoprotein NlpD